ncbi:hypothetical protein CCACVL1_04192 [Corchorus capsularis]|uniref:Uncharacterized protein n=1 Tax=Corchorus capsularis TaxID=210143 RepID=A0A1R3JUP5_COCAP|nr:hypothetical protein CCACVL1_04192 [Corchorus capsularis]
MASQLTRHGLLNDMISFKNK